MLANTWISTTGRNTGTRQPREIATFTRFGLDVATVKVERPEPRNSRTT